MFVVGGFAAIVGACTRISEDDDSAEQLDRESSFEPAASPEPTPEPTATETATPEPTSTPEPEPELEPEPVEEPEPEPEPEPELTPFEELDQDPNWAGALRTPAGHIMGVVNNDSLNIRSAPTLDAEVADITYSRHTLQIFDVTYGDEVNGDSRWFRVGDEQYATAAFIQPFVPPEPPETYEDFWIDVNLSSFYAVVYNWGTPRYGALITAGRGDRTPEGVFQIIYRVESETMDSTTVGIDEDDPEHYFLEDVRYTQYFKEGGYAVHGNYWSEPWEFGQFTSNGCVGLRNHDAEWVWALTDVGSTVSIHF
jgi:hypothetical protein